MIIRTITIALLPTINIIIMQRKQRNKTKTQQTWKTKLATMKWKEIASNVIPEKYTLPSRDMITRILVPKILTRKKMMTTTTTIMAKEKPKKKSEQ